MSARVRPEETLKDNLIILVRYGVPFFIEVSKLTHKLKIYCQNIE